MNIPGVIMLIALFISNALALYFLYNEKAQFSGVCNIASLCLTVALAYHFNQIKSIALVVGIVIAVAIAAVIIRIIIGKQLKERKNRVESEESNDTAKGEKKNENN